MANFAGLQAAIDALTTDVEKKQMLYYKLLMNEDIETNFTLVPNMHKGMLTPTFKIGRSVRPFNTTMNATDTQVIGGKTLALFPNKIEEEVNPQKYYDHWETLGLKGQFDPNDFPLANFIIESLIEENADQIRTTELYSAKRNNSGTTSSAIIDGFGTLIAGAITGGQLPSQYIETSVGTPTSSNILDAVHKVVELTSPAYRKQPGMQVLVAETLWNDYYDAYKAENGGNKPDMEGDAIILEKWRNIRLKKEISMTTANSKRIIATGRDNLQVGTNMSKFKDYVLKTYDKGWLFNILMYFEMNCGIFEFDHGAFACNEDE